MKKTLLLLGFLAAAWAQPQQVNLSSSPPPPISAVSVSLIGNPGNATYCYYVVAIYPRGKAFPAGPACAYNAPSTLTGSNYVALSWSAAAGATGYDVIRTAGNSFPSSGVCANCAVATGQPGVTVNDQGGSLGSYTLAIVGSAQATWLLNNRDYAAPRMVSDTTILVPGVAFPDGTLQTTAAVGGASSLTGSKQFVYDSASGTLAPGPLFRQSANVLEQMNGGNVQIHNIYGNYTDASNYLRLRLQGNTGPMLESVGTGGAASYDFGTGVGNDAAVHVNTTGSRRWSFLGIGSGGHLIAAVDNAYDIGASGANRPRNVFVAGNGTFGGMLQIAGDLNFTIGTRQISNSAGNIKIYANGGGTTSLGNNGVDQLIMNGAVIGLGGLTSAFPAFKRNVTSINFRLADDSGDAPITAAGATFSNGITVGFGYGLGMTGTNNSIQLDDTLGVMILRGIGSGISFRATNSGFNDFKITNTGVMQVGGSDLGIYRNAAGVLEVNSGIAGVLTSDVKFQKWISTPIPFGSLGTPVNGSIVYCLDCTITSPCAGSGTGAFAKRLNATWVCN